MSSVGSILIPFITIFGIPIVATYFLTWFFERAKTRSQIRRIEDQSLKHVVDDLKAQRLGNVMDDERVMEVANALIADGHDAHAQALLDEWNKNGGKVAKKKKKTDPPTTGVTPRPAHLGPRSNPWDVSKTEALSAAKRRAQEQIDLLPPGIELFSEFDMEFFRMHCPRLVEVWEQLMDEAAESWGYNPETGVQSTPHKFYDWGASERIQW